MFFSNVTITVHLHIVDVLDVTSGKVDFSMGEDGNSALKTGGPVPFDVSTTSDLCGLRVAMTRPIDLEHMPTHALRKGKGALLHPFMAMALIDKIDQEGAVR